MLDILKALLLLRQFKKTKPLVKAVFTYSQAEEIARNAMAYAWEIGMGAPLVEQVRSTPGNPFLNDNWRELVRPGAETDVK